MEEIPRKNPDTAIAVFTWRVAISTSAICWQAGVKSPQKLSLLS